MWRKWAARGFLVIMVWALVAGLGLRPLNREEQKPPPATPRQLAAEQFRRFQAFMAGLPESPPEVTLVAVGDIMLSRFVGRKIKRLNDYHHPFHRVRDILKAADLVFGNLECPITPGREIVSKEMIFRADPEVVEALKAANFSVLSLANNHTLNFGHKGLADTCRYLEQAGIHFVGAGRNEEEANRTVFLEKNGITLAFLAYNAIDTTPPALAARGAKPGTSLLDLGKMAAAVQAARARADIVVVSVHHGAEYSLEPARCQREFCRAAIDAGAHLVIGHHPHVMQPLEVYGRGLILYSLGNFVFDQPFPHTRDSVMVRVHLRKTGVAKAEFIPYVIEGFTQPAPLNPGHPAAAATLRKLKAPLATKLLIGWNEKAQTFEQQTEKILYLSGETPPGRVRRTRNLHLEGLGQGAFTLADGRLRLEQGGRLLWESPPEWWVQDFSLGDLNGDGRPQVALSLWRMRGREGPPPLLPVSLDFSINNYLKVFRLRQQSLESVWQSPALARPLEEWLLADLTGDGRADLVALERDSGPGAAAGARALQIWHWQEEGFVPRWRGPSGGLRHLRVESRGEGRWVGVETPPPAPAAAGAPGPPCQQGTANVMM